MRFFGFLGLFWLTLCGTFGCSSLLLGGYCQVVHSLVAGMFEMRTGTLELLMQGMVAGIYGLQSSLGLAGGMVSMFFGESMCFGMHAGVNILSVIRGTAKQGHLVCVVSGTCTSTATLGSCLV